MQRNHFISTVPNLTQGLAKLAAGSWLFLDLDETLLHNGIKKYKDQPHITEPGLPAEIARLRERGVKVFGLTARDHMFSEQTKEHLLSLGIELDEIIHAPSVSDNDKKIPQKGSRLSAFLERHPDHPVDIIVADDLKEQLEDIQQALAGLPIRLHLWHYVNPHYQPINLDPETDHIFPLNLEGFKIKEEYFSSRNTVVRIEHAESGRELVLKSCFSDEHARVEMLCNVVYRAMGVKVPEMRVYRQLPSNLAQVLNLKQTNGMFKVCVKIDKNSQQDERYIRDTARTAFAAHVLIGNIDVAKEKNSNYLLDKENNAWLVDAGANFIFRPRGKPRIEPANLASEMDSLRDKQINELGHEWFGSLTDAEIEQQILAIVERQQIIEKSVWDACHHLDLPVPLCNQFLENLSDRLDRMVMRFCHGSQPFAKVDKKAIPGYTSAGILTYTMLDNNIPHLLLSKRVRHEWWDNFGGKSDSCDVYLHDTARREVGEESKKMLNFTTTELIASSFHDIITGSGRKQRIYRMYIAPYHQIDLKRLTDDEHTDHQYVRLENVLTALDTNQLIDMEDQKTIMVAHDQGKIALYPPLLTMLRQKPVLENLRELMRSARLKRTKTLSDANISVDQQTIATYRPLITPVRKRHVIADVVKKKSDLLREIKRTREVRDEDDAAIDELPDTSPVKKAKEGLTQSEIHLKAILGASYKAGDLEGNIRRFVMWHAHYCSTEADREKLIQKALELIGNEKVAGGDEFYFYHSCNSQIAFMYDFYNGLYQALYADDRWIAFRPDHDLFRKFTTITEFIAHYSEDGKIDIHNNAEFFHDCAIAVNLFFFGCHNTPTSHSPCYLVANKVRRKVDMTGLFANLLRSFQVTPEEIQRLVTIADICTENRGGMLYQAAMPPEQALLMGYPATLGGVMNAWQGSRNLPAVMQDLRNTDLANTRTTGYIEDLQGRFIVPPHVPLTVKSVRWIEADERSEALYQQHVQQAVNLVLDVILHQHNKLHRKDRLAPALRVLPSILEANQLPLPAKISEIELAQAFIAHDITAVRTILKIHPELLSKRINLSSRTYIENEMRDRHANDIIPLLVMARNLPMYMAVFRDCFGENWLDLLKGKFIRYDTLHDFSQNLLCIPADKRFDFYQCCALQHMKIELVYTILRDSLPEEQLVAMSLQAKSPYLAILILPKTRRLAHALSITQEEGQLISHKDFTSLLGCLEGIEKQIFYNVRISRVYGESSLVGVIKETDPDQRYDLAMACCGFVADIYESCEVLELLPPPSQLAFAATQTAHLTCAEDLADMTALLDDNQMLPFINSHIELMITASDIDSLVALLLDDEKMQFFMTHYALVKTEDEMESILRRFTSEEVTLLAKFMLDDKRSTFHRVFLTAVPDKKEFINTYLNELLKLTSGVDLVYILAHEDRSDFINKEHKNIITEYAALQQILGTHLNPENRLEMAIQYIHFITEDNLPEIKKLLTQEEEPRLQEAWEKQFVKKHKHSVMFFPSAHESIGETKTSSPESAACKFM